MSDFFAALGSVFSLVIDLKLWGISLVYYLIGVALVSLVIAFLKGERGSKDK